MFFATKRPDRQFTPYRPPCHRRCAPVAIRGLPCAFVPLPASCRHLALAQPAAPPAKAPASLHGNATESLRNLKANRGSTTKHGHRRMAMPPHRYGITGKPSPGRQFANKAPAGKPPRRGHCLQQQKWTATDSHRCRPLKIYNPKIHTSFSNEKGALRLSHPHTCCSFRCKQGFTSGLTTFLPSSHYQLLP